MLTVRYRLNNRFRPIEADPELLAAVAAAAAAPQHVESVFEVKPKLEELIENEDKKLIDKIRRIEFVSIHFHERNFPRNVYLGKKIDIFVEKICSLFDIYDEFKRQKS